MTLTDIYNPDDTICAVSTPQGTGAIALIRISGPDTFRIVSDMWKGADLSTAATHSAHLGYIIDPATGEAVDQAVATVFRGPRSFTGDDTIELSLHGSRWIQRQAISLLIRNGARAALPGEFTRRAFSSGKLDLAEAEAVADLIASSSRAGHRLAMSQLRGHFSKRLDGLRDELIELASLLELELDFSEEDVEFASRQKLSTLASALHRQLSSLADSFTSGAAIKDGIPVAIIGPTNAGKSSLLNVLIGDERAIVSDIHGTTRDIVEDTMELGPYLIRFKDTAGLRETDDTIERIGIDRSRQAARSAGIVIYVIDPTAPPSPVDIQTEIAHLDSSRIIFAINKSDLAQNTVSLPPDSQAVVISAITGDGIEKLREALTAKIEVLTGATSEDGLMVTNARHASALEAAAQSALRVVEGLDSNLPPDLIAQDLRETLHHLSSITGEITTPDILQSIFSRFCIGK